MEVSETEIRASALQVAAEGVEALRFGYVAAGVYAAFTLALDYLGFWLVMIAGRPGYSMLSVGLDSEVTVILSKDAERATADLMDSQHSGPEWKEAILEALKLCCNGNQLVVGTIVTPAMAIMETNSITPSSIVANLAISTPTIALSLSLGNTSILIHPADPQVGLKIMRFLAEEGYRRSCDDKPQRNSDKCLVFLPDCRDHFRNLVEIIDQNLQD